MASIEIVHALDGRGSVKVDGREIGHLITRNCRVIVGENMTPKLQVEISAHVITERLAGDLTFALETRRLLVEHGWIPPR